MATLATALSLCRSKDDTNAWSLRTSGSAVSTRQKAYDRTCALHNKTMSGQKQRAHLATIVSPAEDVPSLPQSSSTVSMASAMHAATRPPARDRAASSASSMLSIPSSLSRTSAQAIGKSCVQDSAVDRCYCAWSRTAKKTRNAEHVGGRRDVQRRQRMAGR